MRILINQTTRMGDMIQTAPLIRQLRHAHPAAHLAALVRGMSKTIAERHPDLNEVIVYDEHPMFLDMRSGDSERLLHAYRAAEACIARLKEGRFDIVYNMTHSLSSAMLARLAEIPQVAGADMSEDWQFVLRGAWPNYFFTSVFSRDYNDLNLCDITRHFAADAPPCRDLPFTIHDQDEEDAARLLAEHGIERGAPLICMQLGASESSKRWAEHRFAELARHLAAETGARIALLGVEGEASLGKNFEQFAPGLAAQLFGKTSIPQLAAILARSRLLVTNDTGTMHLAAAVKCPVALVSIGHVHFRETGPWGTGHVAIEVRRATTGRSDFVPGAQEDRERITASHVLCAARAALQAGGGACFRQMPDSAEMADIELHYAAFAEDGCLQYYPLLRRPMVQRDFVRAAYRRMWLEHLRGITDDPAETRSLRRLLSHYCGPEREIILQWRNEIAAAFEGLAQIARRGMAATEELLETLKQRGRMAKARQLVGYLMALDEEARIFSEVHPACKPLVLMARFERENLEGADPLPLAQTTHAIYAACAERATLMCEKVDRVADLAIETCREPAVTP